MHIPAYLSVIIPCYNGEKTIESTVQSVLSQKHSEIELIIVNDGSCDNTERICKKYANSGAIRYFCIENSGAGYARNFGIEKATGEWVAFLDADDLFIEGSMDKAIPKLREYEAQGIDIIYTAITKGDMQLNNPIVKYAEPIDEICHIPQCEFVSCFYSKNYLERNKIRFFEYREQDIETAFRYRVISNSPIAVTDNEISFYFQRINPDSNTHTWKQDVMHRIKSRVYLELLEENKIKREADWLLKVVLNEIKGFYLQCVKYGCKDKKNLSFVNETYVRAIKYSKTISKDKGLVRCLIICKCYRVLGNTLGRRKTRGRV